MLRLRADFSSNDSTPHNSARIGKSKVGGITPTTSHCAPSIRVLLPTIAGSAPNRRRHSPSLRITRVALAVISSSGRNVRPDRRVRVERGKEFRRHEKPEHAFGLVAADEIRVPPVHPGEVIDGAAAQARPPVEEIGGRHGFAPPAPPRRGADRHHDPIDVAHREGPQQQRIDDAEHRHVGADAQCQRHDNRHRRRWLLEERAEREPDVHQQTVHTVSLRRLNGRNGMGAAEDRARRESNRVRPIPASRVRGRMRSGDGGIGFVEIAEDVVAIRRRPQGPRQQLFRDAGRPRDHDEGSSFDSRPSHNPRSTRRDWRRPRSPAAVTVK